MSEVVASGIINASALNKFIATQTTLVDEAKWHLSDDGIRVRAMDAATVAMLETELDKGAFESYQSPGEAVVGVPLTRLTDKLDIIDAGELVEVKLDMETRSLKLETGHITQEVALIDPDAIREEPDMPEIQDDMTTQAAITSDALTQSRKAVELVTDHVIFASDEGAETLSIYGEGDIEDTKAEFDRDHEDIHNLQIEEDCETALSITYVEDALGPVPSGARVDLAHGEEFPVQFWYECVDGDVSVHNIISPRIRKD